MTATEQAVVEQPDGQAVPASDGADAQEDLDTLLAEYSETGETEKVVKEPTEVESKDDLKSELAKISSIERMLNDQRAEQARTTAKTEIDSTVKSIKGDLNIPDKFIKAFLNERAAEDPRLEQAYLAKSQNPDKWAAIETKLRAELQGFLEGLIDKDATETRETITSSVLNAKSTTPGPKSVQLSKMSDLEFEQFKKEQLKAYRSL